jgi:probable rRNA maturation factor
MKKNFSFTNKTKQKIPSRYFLLTLENFLKRLTIKNGIEVTLILVGKKRIQKLNYIYRKKNKPTDVLSFPIDITGPLVGTTLELSLPKGEPIILGDIYICPEMVEKGELQNTFLHGLIHLIGCDHEKNEKEWNKVLKKIKSNY